MNDKRKDFMFDKRAASYDDGFEGKVSRKFYTSLLNQIQLFPNYKVLDVGCGTGALLRKMADLFDIKGYGVDFTENMIAEAKKSCPEMSISFSLCDETHFDNNTFDVIIACMAYHHFAEKEGFAKEAARIIKPDGFLYIADPAFPIVIRKTINGILKLLRVVGYFGTAQEIAPVFEGYGFVLDNVFKDGYVQIVALKKMK